MISLLRRKSKHPVPGAAPTVPITEAEPVDVAAGSLTAAAGQPAPSDEAGQPARSWPYALPVVLAPPWAVDEMLRIEQCWQDGALVVRTELPGIDPARDVRLTVVNGRLAIEAERHQADEVERDGFMLRELRYGTFSRSVPLAAGVTASSITATYKDGLLEVRIPAAVATSDSPPTRIPVTTS